VSVRIVVSLDEAIVAEVELTKPVTVVGRHPTCDVVIDHPAVSGRHMLFRMVSRTVYAEDLASTNGIKVNGIPTMHHVVHHLDLIEVGRHKLHFFDGSLLAGGVGDLDDTVLTEYERTMLAAASAQAPAPRDPSKEDITRTMAIPREVAIAAATAASVDTAIAPAGTFALKVLSGENAGSVIGLDRANTMIGTPGGDTALVVKRGASLFIARLGGRNPPQLNGTVLGPGTHPIGLRDVVEVGGSRFEVISR
jgi:hypothetical protein